MSSDTHTDTTVEAFLRMGPVFGTEHQRQAVVDRLDALERDGKIARYDVRVWGDAVRPDGPLAGTELHRRTVERVEEFERWLHDNDMAAEYTFCHRSVESAVAGEEYEAVVLPAVCLAVYESGRLAGVYPCRDGESADTVSDCLDGLETGERRVVVDGPAR